jgi:spore coat polysaccharide biosynthesis protein SpsF (cytidylyltransferase family)
MPLAGRPLLGRVLDRVRAFPMLDEVVVATSDHPSDDAIERFLASEGVACVRGSLDDVLARFAAAAADLGDGDCVARVTADNPFYDADAAAAAFALHRDGGWEYTHVEGLSHVVPELVLAGTLRRAAAEATAADEREHVTPYLRRHAGRFRVLALPAGFAGLDPACDRLLTVDSPDDHARAAALLEALGAHGPPPVDACRAWLRERGLAPAAP